MEIFQMYDTTIDSKSCLRKQRRKQNLKLPKFTINYPISIWKETILRRSTYFYVIKLENVQIATVR